MGTEFTPPEKISDEEFEACSLGREPSSIRDLQYLYGHFNLLGRDLSEWTVDQEFAGYLTPDEGDDLLGDPQNLILLDFKVDQETESVKLLGATVETLDEWYVDKIAHSRYDPGVAVDHSITLKTGDNGPQKVSRKHVGKVIGTWPSQDGVKNALKNHPQRWLVDGIASKEDSNRLEEIQSEIYLTLVDNLIDEKVTEDEPDNWLLTDVEVTEEEDQFERVKAELYQKLANKQAEDKSELVELDDIDPDEVDPEDLGDIDTQRHMISVRFTEASAEDYSNGIDREDWSYVADTEVLLEAMASRQENKWATKHGADSKGEGACYVLGGEDKDLYGMAPDPMYLFTANQKSWMPNYDIDEVVSINPISGDATSFITHSNNLMDACFHMANGGRLYQLPYMAGEQTAEKLRCLYRILWEAKQAKLKAEQSEDTQYENPIDLFYQVAKNSPDVDPEIANNLKFWTLFIAREQAMLSQAMAEVKGTSVLHHVDVADAAAETARQMRDKRHIRTTEDMAFADPDANHLKRVSSLSYFLNTTSNTPADGSEMDANSPAFVYYDSVLRGKQIDFNKLVTSYVDRIDEEYDHDSEYPFPGWLVAEQYAQLLTLERAGLLNTEPVESNEHKTQFYNIMTENTETNNDETESKSQQIAEAESNAYKEFIAEHGLLTNSPENRAAFTLGALTTTVAQYQRNNGKNPITNRVNPKSITKYNFQSRTTDLIELVNTYASVDRKVMRYNTMISQLSDDLAHTMPKEWDLNNETIQFFFSLGMGFGATYHGPEDEDGNEEEQDAESNEVEAEA